ncbi:uncharacterized protein LOC131956273 [Physella acuta]|uniref:uncharacterized protein LOC131956273 n=1 Tax=Physella acuta TaxID=109671 RepID=UPI0027DDBF77|nr:uncharacterized protein LOC131956273 [Physella acuta]
MLLDSLRACFVMSRVDQLRASKRQGKLHTAYVPQGGTVTKVKTVPGHFRLALMILLVFVTDQVCCTAMVEEHETSVTFRTKICQKLSPTELKKRLGPAFDDKMMADMPPGAEAGPDPGNLDPGRMGFLGDDPSVVKPFMGSENDWVEEDGSEPGTEFQKRTEVYRDVEVVEKTNDPDAGRSWLPRKVLNRGASEDAKRENANHRSPSNNKRRVDISKSYSFMRRRRSLEEAAPPPRGKNSDRDSDTPEDVHSEEDYEDEAGEGKDKKSNDNFLALKIATTDKNKSMRKNLKKKFRQKTKNMSKPPPWECKMERSARLLGYGFFPRVIWEGRCLTDKCFYRLYSCQPVKYVVKLLSRDPATCNPLPSLTNATVFEEKWDLQDYHVIVGCNCVSLAANANTSSRKHKSRTRS